MSPHFSPCLDAHCCIRMRTLQNLIYRATEMSSVWEQKQYRVFSGSSRSCTVDAHKVLFWLHQATPVNRDCRTGMPVSWTCQRSNISLLLAIKLLQTRKPLIGWQVFLMFHTPEQSLMSSWMSPRDMLDGYNIYPLLLAKWILHISHGQCDVNDP